MLGINSAIKTLKAEIANLDVGVQSKLLPILAEVEADFKNKLFLMLMGIGCFLSFVLGHFLWR